ncbi:hypothetical protein TWF481_005021 [Arthrobotrys musiformis]|uniref:Uncharacterized protein n=1 Tax=Arthrobotrys musiformis TaxID=47236 RepID=A0AAV9WL98_9PEZI
MSHQSGVHGNSDTSSTSVKLQDTRTGQNLGLFGTNLREITSVAFSPCRALVASASSDGDIKIFSLQNEEWSKTQNQNTVYHEHVKKLLHPLRGENRIVIAFSPNGKALAIATRDMRILLWDIAEKKVFRHQLFLYEQRFAPSEYMMLRKQNRIEIGFSNTTEIFAHGNPQTSRITIPTTATCPDHEATKPNELPTCENAVYLGVEGVYMHGRKVFDIPDEYEPSTFDYKDGTFAVGSLYGHVYFIKLRLEHLLNPVT